MLLCFVLFFSFHVLLVGVGVIAVNIIISYLLFNLSGLLLLLSLSLSYFLCFICWCCVIAVSIAIICCGCCQCCCSKIMLLLCVAVDSQDVSTLI